MYSKADTSRLNLPCGNQKLKSVKTRKSTNQSSWLLCIMQCFCYGIVADVPLTSDQSLTVLHLDTEWNLWKTRSTVGSIEKDGQRYRSVLLQAMRKSQADWKLSHFLLPVSEKNFLMSHTWILHPTSHIEVSSALALFSQPVFVTA